MKKIFISYRHHDSAGTAGRIHDRLNDEFDVFFDVSGIPIGEDFVRVLSDEVGKCDVLLVVIGPTWIDARDKEGKRRLEDEQDPVRIEIAAALKRAIPVVPILLDGVTIPKKTELPDDIQGLSSRIGIEIRHPSFHDDIGRLITKLNARPPPNTPPIEVGQHARIQRSPGFQDPRNEPPLAELFPLFPQKLFFSEKKNRDDMKVLVSCAPVDDNRKIVLPEYTFVRKLARTLCDELQNLNPKLHFSFSTELSRLLLEPRPDFFMAILSPSWSADQRCREQLSQFEAIYRFEEGPQETQSRLFAVYVRPLDPAIRADSLRDLPEYRFYEQELWWALETGKKDYPLTFMKEREAIERKLARDLHARALRLSQIG